MKYLMIALAFLAGCEIGVGNHEQGQETGQSSKTNHESSVRFLCVGMEYSARFGSCPGCSADATRMSNLLSGKYGYTGDTLISEKATKFNVVNLLKSGIDGTPEDGMFIFVYSGHGGQEYLGGDEPSGADEEDEYLCLYDRHMLDDEIWDIVRACRGRVFMYFDACHSATMYRSVSSELLYSSKGSRGRVSLMSASNLIRSSGFTFSISDNIAVRPLSTGGSSVAEPRIMCWSGCKESEYSYGGSNGGVMTSALIRNWHEGITYVDLWSCVVRDVRKAQPTQNPVCTKIGSGFSWSMEAFR